MMDLNTVIERLKARRNYYNAMIETGNADQEAWYRQSVVEMDAALSHLKAMQAADHVERHMGPVTRCAVPGGWVYYNAIGGMCFVPGDQT